MAASAAGSGEPALEDKVAYLSQPGSYPDRPACVEVVQTHMSWVFLTDRHAYKLKKPARRSFLDFSTLAARHHYCKEEVRLNRRLAASVYLDVVGLTAERGGTLRLQGEGEVVEWLVKMRRLPRERMLDALLRTHALVPADLNSVSRLLMAFYGSAAAEPMNPASYSGRIEMDLMTNHTALREFKAVLNATRLATLQDAHAHFLHDHGILLEQRAARGKIVEAHGDLRPEHICLLRAPVIIDCLEFNREFRLLDAAHELAYLAMECEFQGAPWVGAELFRAYRENLGDGPPATLLRFYQSERAVLRAKLALWHLQDQAAHEHAKWVARAQAYLALAIGYCDGL